MVNNFFRVHPVSPSFETMQRAAEHLKAGESVVFPTRTLYGLGVDPFNETALERLFEIKQRPADRPVSVLIRDRRDLAALVSDLPSAARRLMDAFWPGGLTIVLRTRHNVPDRLTAGTGRIGVRLPEHPVAAALVAATNGPITATSANLSGRPGCFRTADLHSNIVAAVSMVLDAGPLPGGVGSTVLDMTENAPRILREGTVPATEVARILGTGTVGGR